MSVKKCEISTQLKFLEGYPGNHIELLIEKLNNEPNIKYWAFAVHDQDVNKDGEAVEPHVHIVLELLEGRQFSTIGNYVGVKAQYVSNIKQKVLRGKRWMVDIGGALSYLTHANAPGKHQYPDEIVVAKENYDWKEIRRKSEAEMAAQKTFNNIMKLISEGSIRGYNIFDIVPPAQYVEHKVEFERALEHYEGKLKTNNDRNMEVIYIYGEAGSGKTEYAKAICEEYGYSYCLSGSNRDPVQEYKGQDCLIIDDARPSSYQLQEWLKLLDNNTSSAVGARYKDRWITADMIILTTVLSIEKFYNEFFTPNEPIEQLKRRCGTMIEMTKDKIKVHKYNPDTKDYDFIVETDNPMKEKFEHKSKEISEAKFKRFCEKMNIPYKN